MNFNRQPPPDLYDDALQPTLATKGRLMDSFQPYPTPTPTTPAKEPTIDGGIFAGLVEPGKCTLIVAPSWEMGRSFGALAAFACRPAGILTDQPTILAAAEARGYAEAMGFGVDEGRKVRQGVSRAAHFDDHVDDVRRFGWRCIVLDALLPSARRGKSRDSFVEQNDARRLANARKLAVAHQIAVAGICAVEMPPPYPGALVKPRPPKLADVMARTVKPLLGWPDRWLLLAGREVAPPGEPPRLWAIVGARDEGESAIPVVGSGALDILRQVGAARAAA